MSPGGGGGGGGGGLSPTGGIGPADPYFLSVAWGDIDADGNVMVVYGYSMTNELVIKGDGE
jgi:hypothetical protein